MGGFWKRLSDTVVVVTAFNLNLNMNESDKLSSLALANIEALAQNEATVDESINCSNFCESNSSRSCIVTITKSSGEKTTKTCKDCKVKGI